MTATKSWRFSRRIMSDPMTQAKLREAEMKAKDDALASYKLLLEGIEQDYRQMEAVCDEIIGEFGEILPDDIGVQVAKSLSAELKSSADYIQAFLAGDMERAALIREATE
tara:strand:- start:45569 stop:45898 length:330 start_codon:yes stop_codon:yes gene_type:complete